MSIPHRAMVALLGVIVGLGLLLAISLNAHAQDFGVGETVICKPTGTESDWREGVVTENNPTYSFIRVRCGPGRNGNPGGIFLVDRKDVRKSGDVEAKQKADGVDQQHPANGPAVGQMVLCLPTGSEGDKRTGRVLENNPLYDFIRVECPAAADGRPGGIFLVARKDVLSPNAVTVPAGKPVTPSPAAATGETASANQGNCACPSQTQASGSSVEDNIKRTIIARYVRNGGALDAGHTPSTVHFDSFQIVGTRPYKMPVPGAYHTGSPDGPGGRMGTQVYEVVCKYTVCIDYPGYAPSGYRGRIESVDHDAGYTCFIDTQGSWRCNQSKDRMTTKSIDK